MTAPVPPVEFNVLSRETQRRDLWVAMDAFLARGGAVTQVATGVSALTPAQPTADQRTFCPGCEKHRLPSQFWLDASGKSLAPVCRWCRRTTAARKAAKNSAQGHH